MTNNVDDETYGAIALAFNLDDNTYSVSILAGIDAEHYWWEAQNDDNPTGTWRQRSEVARELVGIPLPTGGLLLSGSRAIEVEEGITGQLTWSFSPTAGKRPEVLLIAPKNYDTWMPEAGADEAANGNAIDVGFALEAPKGSKEPVTRGAIWRFQLVDVSAEPGTCLNHPPKAQAKTSPDLAFEAGPDMAVAKDGKSAWSTVPMTAGTVRVRSHDWAAYGRVKATAEVEGQTIDAELRGQPGLMDLTIPKDADHDKVADAFEGAQLARGERDDAEDTPPSTVAGDAWSHYEEYRGLMAMRGGSEGHVRLDPAAKDLVYGDDGGLLDPTLWLQVTHIKPVRIAAARMETLPSDPIDRGTRWNSSYASLPDRGIPWLDAIAGDGMAPGITMWQDLQRREVPRAGSNDADDDTWVMILGSTSRMRARVWPTRVEFYVRVYLPYVLDKAQTEPSRMSAQVFKAAGYTTAQAEAGRKALQEPVTRARITKQLMNLTAIHELLHAIGVPHHDGDLTAGDPGCVMRYFAAADKFGIIFGEAMKPTGTPLPLSYGKLCTSGAACRDKVDFMHAL